MVRAFVLYEGDVDTERYQRHIEEFVRPIPATFRHGKVFAAAPGMEQFAASGKDAAGMGIPFSVHFTELE